MSTLKKLRLGLDDRFAFLRGFLEDPKQVGSVIPSSSFLERRLVELGAIGQARSVLELGCGTAGTTRALLEAMPRDGRLLVIEINPRFHSMAGRIEDPRLSVHLGSAERLQQILAEHAFPAPQAVVSGIPFSTMGDELAGRILESIQDVLEPQGRFVAYQVRSRVKELGAPHFGRARVEIELLNIPPVRVFHWQKNGARSEERSAG